MSRYIDADEFGRCLRNYRPYVDSGRSNAIQTEVNQVLDCIEYEIEDTPSIDIIRCEECKRVREDGGHANCGGYLYCRKWKTLVDEDCFCSWGERRE